MSDNFVHLHVHSEYSMLDGASRLDDLVLAAGQLEMPAIAVTDHGNMFGAYSFYETAHKLAKNGKISAEVKPIIGLEAYLTPGTPRGERKRVQWGDGSGDDVSAAGAYTHMTMWAETTEGMHNLFRLASKSSLEGYFYKPRADRELLNEYAKGLIATTGCPSGEVQTFLRLGQYENALKSAAEFRDIFGKENFFVELMDHGLEIENRVREDLLRLAKDLDLPLVATNDLHYVKQSDSVAHDLLLCVNSGSTVETPNRFHFDGDGYYLKSAAEMRALFSDLPQACDNTLAIAERCNVEFTGGSGTYMAKADIPGGETEESWFRKEVQRGLEYRYPEGVPEYASKQADYEMGVIVGKEYQGYFLVVADFIKWAKTHGVRVGPGRGSGAASMCAYALRITDLDPVQHRLIFERFLNPERPSMPDFDIDFDDRRRSDVIQYVTQKYGSERVAQIVTYGSIKAKQALKDSARVLGKPYALGEMLTKAYPKAMQGNELDLKKLFDPSDDRYGEGSDFRAIVESDPEATQVLKAARGLEGLKRQWGVHAAGVIMSSDPLIDIVPIMKRESDGAIITQFDYHACEALGLVKMDFLGLKNLTILDDALINVKANKGIDVDLDALGRTLDDPQTYELLATGDTLGVFQLDSSGIRNLLKLMRPKTFDDISAAIALFRPGPMGANSHTNYALRRNGEQAAEMAIPELAEPLEEILGYTFGLIVYQEQVQQMAQKLAGYSLGAADGIRKAIGKKDAKKMKEERQRFLQGMLDNGYKEESFNQLWDLIASFASYAFNKGHSASYAVISYWTAYLKAHYPVEFMAALLESAKDDKAKLAVYLAECRRMGIDVLSPDVNESVGTFTPVTDKIRFGLGAIRNVGENVVKGILEAREEHQKASDFNVFLDNVPAVVCNKRVLESLIKAGAFDSMGHSRRALMECYENKMESVMDYKRNAAIGQDDLFGGFNSDDPVFESSPIPDIDEWDKTVRLGFEREMLGLYVSDHPLRGQEEALRKLRSISISDLVSAEGPKSGQVTLAGMVTNITRKVTKKGDNWAIVRVEDLDASVEVMVYPRVYQDVAIRLIPDSIVAIKGRLREREEGVDVNAAEVRVLELSESNAIEPVVISLPTSSCTPEIVSQLKSVLTRHPGPASVLLELISNSQQRKRWALSGFLVNDSPSLASDMKALLGPNCLTH